MGQVWTLKGCHENKQDPCTQAAERIPSCLVTRVLTCLSTMCLCADGSPLYVCVGLMGKRERCVSCSQGHGF